MLQIPAGLAEGIQVAVGLVADFEVVGSLLMGGHVLVHFHGGLGLTGHLDAVITHVTTLGHCFG